MHILKRLLNTVLLFCVANSVFLYTFVFTHFSMWFKILIGFGMVLWFLFFNIVPCRDKQPSRRLKVLIGGYELFIAIILCLILEFIFYFLLFERHLIGAKGAKFEWEMLANLLMLLAVFFLTAANSYFRVLVTSAQLRVVWRVLLVSFWWLPILNVYLFWKVCRIIKSEYAVEVCKLELDEQRAENEICKTRFPIVLVHGIFFRDWQIVNYWGRIPKELIRNGASIYYAGQQSAADVAQSGAELKMAILKILKETEADKVNIIAHSKGGLDARYAISRLGMASHVASLTTIATPHRGCFIVQFLLDKLPKKMVKLVAKRYNALYQVLGDDAPDFLAGISDLTPARCALFNQETPDAPDVYYQSVATVMKGVLSAPFPLNLSYLLVQKCDKQPNDGLVTRFSAHWGEILEEPFGSGHRGISHGDLIDLLRENISGFDVREFYVTLAHGLKEKGL